MKMRAGRVPEQGGSIEIVEIERPEPGPGQIRIRVEACGICHSDSLTVNKAWPGVTLPRVPGHEIAGVVDAVGEGVHGWMEGDRVGVGWFGGNDGTCGPCRRGDFISCVSLQIPGITYDGGYAEYVVVPEFAAARIPNDLTFEEAAPLMCAGITCFNALRHTDAKAGDVVAVLGIGGLGHLGVQFAAKMGFYTVAIARGSDKAELAQKLGAREYIDSSTQDVGEELKSLGGARVVLATVTNGPAMAAVIPGLGIDGVLMVLGAAMEPMEVVPAYLISGRKTIRGWPSGTSLDSQDTLRFSAMSDVRPMIETMPLDRAQEAYDRMMSGDARFRMVLRPR